MDDFNINNLNECRNEFCSRLINILTPLINNGFNSLLNESITLCKKNNEISKYLMTMQNFLSRIPKWNSTIIDNETERIINESKITYLNDLITCVHIINLKQLTCVRVGQKQKIMNINIPKLNDFIHKVYINCARKLYSNIFLFEKNNTPALEMQKNNREIELIIKEEILNTIRQSIPVEDLLRNYLDETVEEEIVQEVIEQKTETVDINENTSKNDIKESNTNVTKDNTNNNVTDNNATDNNIIDNNVNDNNVNDNNVTDNSVTDNIVTDNNNLDFDIKIEKENNNSDNNNQKTLHFNDVDTTLTPKNEVENIIAPKDIETLEQISALKNEQRKNDESDEEDKIKISDNNVDLNLNDITDININDINDINVDNSKNENLEIQYEVL